MSVTFAIALAFAGDHHCAGVAVGAPVVAAYRPAATVVAPVAAYAPVPSVAYSPFGYDTLRLPGFGGVAPFPAAYYPLYTAASVPVAAPAYVAPTYPAYVAPAYAYTVARPRAVAWTWPPAVSYVAATVPAYTAPVAAGVPAVAHVPADPYAARTPHVALRPDREPPVIVEMTESTFEPSRVTIRVGETVEWRNVSGREHTVTLDPYRVRDPANFTMPRGAEPFHSGRLRPGEGFVYTFTVPGTYRYVCLPHEEMGMVGEVVVEP